MSISRFVRAAALATTVAAAAAPAVAGAKPVGKPKPTVPAHVRVIDPSASEVAAGDFTIYTDTTHIKASKQATCFGDGTGGSGKSFTLKGATALGALSDAGEVQGDLKPLLVTDHFLDQFGPGVCGIGGSVASGDSFWDLFVNHKSSQIGGGQKLKPHADVLWYLAPSYPAGPELKISAPAIVPSPGSYPVTVYQYDPDTGARSPAQGVNVDFASSPTDVAGHTMIDVSGTPGTVAGVGATRASDSAIPDVTSVCIGTAADCPIDGDSIYGSPRDDRISTTPRDDYIAAGKGADTINLTPGGDDIVNCGAGKDKVIVKSGDRDDRIHDTCEKVVKR